MNLSRINGITATIVACANCGLTAVRIAAKLEAKYGMSQSAALAMTLAVLSVIEEG